MEFNHVSVLLDECIDNLNIKEDGVYVDCTMGGAGHSKEIVKRLSKDGLFIGFDQDKNAIATATVGLGVKSEGDLVISGTKGYIYVPSPWWKTEYFEVKFENFNYNKKYFYKFEGDGLRYEISDFISLINNNIIENYF